MIETMFWKHLFEVEEEGLMTYTAANHQEVVA